MKPISGRLAGRKDTLRSANYRGVAIQADGKILLARETQGTYEGDFALARYNGVSPVQLIDTLVSNVQALVDNGVLNNGQVNALLIKLQDAIEHISDGQPNTAMNDLQAFINEVNDYIGENILTSAEGQQLISEANTEISQLQH